MPPPPPWLAAALLAAIACGPRVAPAPPPPLAGSEWVVAALGGAPVIAGTNVTLRFSGGGAGGYGGCNWYGGRYTRADSALDIAEIASTARGCLRPAGVEEQEQRLFRILERVASYRVAGGRLLLADSAGDVLLEAAERERAAMDPAGLVGTRWRLHAVGDTVQRTDPAITLDLTATEISGFGGCRGYDGTYVARGDEIGVTSIAMRDTECDAGEAANLREGQFTTDLSEAANYRVSADSLVLLTVSGRRLVFAARR
jgi:heat shock protein HslJ